jgi:hypothetical protein
MLSAPQLNILGNIINSTFGATSSSGLKPQTKYYKPLNYNIRIDVLDEGTLRVNYIMIVTFVNDQDLREQVKRFSDESAKVTKDLIKDVKKRFKSDSGDTLKLKERRSDTSFEMINTSPHSPRKTGRYNRLTLFDIK